MPTAISPAAASSATHAVLAAVLRDAAQLIIRDGWGADDRADYSLHAELTADETIGDAARYMFNRLNGTDTAAACAAPTTTRGSGDGQRSGSGVGGAAGDIVSCCGSGRT